MRGLSIHYSRLLVAAGLGLGATMGLAEGTRPCPDNAKPEMAQTEGIAMAGTAADLWIACDVTLDAASSDSAAAFCAALAEELARGSGLTVHLDGAAAPGAQVVHLTVRQAGASRASAEIATFVQAADGPQPLAEKTLFLSVRDAGLVPGSARALAFPILQLLKG